LFCNIGTYGPQTYYFIGPISRSILNRVCSYRTRRFIIVFTRFCHWNLFCEMDDSVLENAMKNVCEK